MAMRVTAGDEPRLPATGQLSYFQERNTQAAQTLIEKVGKVTS
jgi:hypothetical protein